jgi:hypothetical protein
MGRLVFGAAAATSERQQTFNERVWRTSAEERTKFLAPYPLESFPNAATSLWLVNVYQCPIRLRRALIDGAKK